MEESAWLVYLQSGALMYHVPGYGPDGLSEYRVYHEVLSSTIYFWVKLENGTGEVFDATHIIQILANNTEDFTTT